MLARDASRVRVLSLPLLVILTTTHARTEIFLLSDFRITLGAFSPFFFTLTLFFEVQGQRDVFFRS